MHDYKKAWEKRRANGNGSAWNKGQKLPCLSEEHKESIRLTLIGNKRRLGTKHSEETKKKISEANSGEKAYQWKGGFNCSKKRRARISGAKGTHSEVDWAELKKKYNYMCLCCKVQEPFAKLSEDHIVPLSMGGSNDISNIQPLCRPCNSRKFTKTIDYKALFGQVTVA